LSQFPRQTSAEQLLDERFQLIDTDKHDVIQAGDLLKLAQAVGDDNLTMEQAQAMMAAVQSSTSYWTKEDLQEALRPRQQK
jgi:Ca2+-binding EF-hand superfamily protein